MNCFCMCFYNDRRNSLSHLSIKKKVVSNEYTHLPIIHKPLKNPRFYRTNRDHQARTYDELSFLKGDVLEVEVCKTETMWRAKHTNTSYIKYVDRDMIESEPVYEMNKWFFKNTDRNEAERLLLAEGNVKGSFMVRNKTGSEHAFVLSVRCEDKNFGPIVKHYKINKGITGYYITNRLNFDALDTLIEIYTRDTFGVMGLCQSLKTPCLNNSTLESSF